MSRVLVAGAGIGGLCTALALHARGVPALVVETVSELRPLGVGINLQPAAVAVLGDLGLDADLGASGIATRAHRYVDSSGATIWEEPRGVAAGHPTAQYSLHRGELQMLLLEAVLDRLGADSVRTGLTLSAFRQGPDGVHALGRESSGKAVELDGAALIGADGLRSVVRAALHPGAGRLQPAGVHMWRGLTETDTFLDGRTMILANDHRGARMIAYPCSAAHARRSRSLVNWVCMVPRPYEDGAADWDSPGRLADLLPHFADWNFDWLDVPGLLSNGRPLLQYPMVDREPLTHWSDGRVTLLGDAAHLMYPIGANGASQAILDASAVAAEFAGVRLTGAAAATEVPAAIERYEAARRPATTAIVTANRRMDRAERDLTVAPDGDSAAVLATMAARYRRAVDHGVDQRSERAG